MGGIGSGRRYTWNAKRTTGNCREIDINRWNREGMLAPGYMGLWAWTDRETGERSASIAVKVYTTEAVQLIYTVTRQGEEPRKINYQVPITWTRCNYGGRRPWFICPQCGRRVGKLYAGGVYFLCRHCHNLTYRSSQESGDQFAKAMRHVVRIRRKLGSYETRIDAPTPDKPKGMHWRTYWRLVMELYEAEAKAGAVFRSEALRILGKG